MTASTLQLRDDLVNMLMQSSDEALIAKVHKYYCRMMLKLQSVKTEEEEYISKEEVLAGIDAGLKDVKEGRCRSAYDFLNEL